MIDFNVGKGVYIWRPEVIERGDPNRILARLQTAGVQTVAVKISDGLVLTPNLEPLIRVLRANNIRVAAWGPAYLGFLPRQEAQVVIDACKRYEPEFFLIDVEQHVENNFNGAHMFMEKLRPGLPDVPLGLNTFWSVEQHLDFPWSVFMETVDFVCPQVYWRGIDPVGKLRRSQQEYAAIAKTRSVPMPVVAGDMYTHLGVNPTPDQITQFLSTADTDPTIQGVMMWAADDTQTLPGLWQSFSHYEWATGGVAIPQQPVGWAKIKTFSGMNVRASPEGRKIGFVAKGQLAPIWGFSESNWAAITATQDQWIYLGNPAYAEFALDKNVFPDLPPGLYTAQVTAGAGLKVRNGIGGSSLRALRFGEVVSVYEEADGWARIHPVRNDWVSALYLKRLD